MIFFFGIYVPDIILCFFTGKNIIYGFKRCTHGMVDIIISVLTVSSHTIKVRNAVKILSQLIHMLICIKISGICLLDTLNMIINNVAFTVDKLHLYHFAYSEPAEIVIRH